MSLLVLVQNCPLPGSMFLLNYLMYYPVFRTLGGGRSLSSGNALSSVQQIISGDPLHPGLSAFDNASNAGCCDDPNPRLGGCALRPPARVDRAGARTGATHS